MHSSGKHVQIKQQATTIPFDTAGKGNANPLRSYIAIVRRKGEKIDLYGPAGISTSKEIWLMYNIHHTLGGARMEAGTMLHLNFLVVFIHSVPSESIIYQKDKLWSGIKQYPLSRIQLKGAS